MKHKPVLFLDFDRTLFDTDQFYDWIGEERFSRILDLTAGKIKGPDFSAMVYDDTISFLENAKDSYRVVLLTFAMNTTLQRKKVRGSGLVQFFDDVIITNKSKGTEAKNYLERMHLSGWPICHDCAGRDGGEHVFVDDMPTNIDEVKLHNPEIKTVRIDRYPLSAETEIGTTKPDIFVTSLSLLAPILFV